MSWRATAQNLLATGGRIWDALMRQRWVLPVLLIAGFVLALAGPRLGLINRYLQFTLMLIGINIILTVSLNLINGYMGEFSVGHAGLMAVGAYTASVLTVRVFPPHPAFWVFPVSVLVGGIATALIGLVVAFPSFKTRGDYLAIVTLAFNMIVKSVIENIDALGGPRGFLGMEKLTTLPWTFFWVVAAVWMIRNFVYSKYGRGVLAIREDEIASELMTVNTRLVKLLAFVISSFFAGVAGGLFAHLLQAINPRSFDLLRSTEILIMVYLGGMGSIAGSILGAGGYMLLIEGLRPLDRWGLRMVLIPLLFVALMLFRPRGLVGLRELAWFVPKRDLQRAAPPIKPTSEEAPDVPPSR